MDRKNEISGLKVEKEELQGKLDFYENIINKLPAIIFINEIGHNGDITTIKNIWANKWGLDFIGYKQEEITAMGYDFAKQVYHPDDIEVAPQSLDLLRKDQEVVYFSFSRQKPKDQDDYQWIYARTIEFKTYHDNSTKQSLSVCFELHNEMQSSNQVVSLLSEINRLKNEIKIKSLTTREKEILSLIANGLTDNEIAQKLHISLKTSKTHRNNIIKKLELKNTACLAAFAVECGLK